MHWKHSGQLALYDAMMHGPPGWQCRSPHVTGKPIIGSTGPRRGHGLLSYLPGTSGMDIDDGSAESRSRHECRTLAVRSSLGEIATLFQLRNQLAVAVVKHRSIGQEATKAERGRENGDMPALRLPAPLPIADQKLCSKCPVRWTCAALVDRTDPSIKTHSHA